MRCVYTAVLPVRNRNRVRHIIPRRHRSSENIKAGPGMMFVFYIVYIMLLYRTVRNNATARQDGYQSKGIIGHKHFYYDASSCGRIIIIIRIYT